MPTVFITGANRGLGLEFARQYAADGWRVLATCRDPDQAEDLKTIKGDVTVHALDVSDAGQVRQLAAAMDEAIDVMISNAGVYGSKDVLSKLDASDYLETLRINTVAPVMVAISFLPHLKRSALKKLVAISSQMGSIADNASGGSLAYRASKAGLNAAWKTLSLDIKKDGIAAAVLHPGWVQTRMGGKNAPLEATESINGMRRVIEKIDASSTGKFFSYNGSELPW